MYVVHEVLSVDFKYENRECSYFEGRKPGKGPRTLHISCSALEHEEEALQCVYRGNPHHCKWYNKKGHQPIFYACLVHELIRSESLCKAESVFCSLHCEHIDFHLLGSGKQVYEEVDVIEPEEELYMEEEDLKFRPFI